MAMLHNHALTQVRNLKHDLQNMYIYMYIYIFIYTYVYIYMFVYTDMCMCVYIYVWVYICVWEKVSRDYIYIYTDL
jgi:hypothetical protein